MFVIIILLLISKQDKTVTAIGIQDGQTLKSAPGITENLMKNKLDRDEASKQGGTPGVGADLFSCFLIAVNIGRVPSYYIMRNKSIAILLNALFTRIAIK